MLQIMVAAILMQMPQTQGAEVFLSADQGEALISSIDYFDPAEYMVGPGDQIWITFPGGVPFSGEPEAVSTVVLPIGLDGVMSIPGLVPLDVSGMTLQDLQARIGQSVRSAFGRLSVSSGLARSALFEVPVTGQVASPGMIAVNGLTRLRDALYAAGGPTATASLSTILIVSAQGDSTVHDLNDFLINGNLGSNPLMERNTSLHVFPAETFIVVEGALSGSENMDGFPLRNSLTQESLPVSHRVVLEHLEGESASSALQRAGGLSANANVEGCFILRTLEDSTSIVLPFNPLMGEGTPELNGADRIVVPFAQRFINVIGEVVAPQPVIYAPGMTVSYYLGMAGGFSETARQGGLKLLYQNGEEEDAELTSIVPPGATVVVPRVAVQFWQEYLTILTGVATIVISYQSLFDN